MARLLGVFAKAPVPGRVKTRLCPPLSGGEAAAIYVALLGDTVERLARHCAANGIGFVVAVDGDESAVAPLFPAGTPMRPQRGEDLAARLARFFAESFDAGSGPVAVVGSDAPTLPLARIDAAFGAIDRGADAAFVPDDGGGYCLLALRRPAPALFEGMEMGTASVFADTLARALAARLAIEVLDPWHDVDTPDDLERLATELSGPGTDAPRTRAVLASRRARYPDMKGDWDRRARENARFFVASYEEDTEERFAASGERDASLLFEGLGQLLPAGGTVLEIGCGPGRLLPFVASRVARVVGLDVSGEMLARARARLAGFRNVDLVEGDGTTLAALPSATFDTVFSYIVFQHLPRRTFAAYLPEIRRVLRPGGSFLFQVPWVDGETPAEPPDDDTYAMRYQSEEEARARLEASGFRWEACRRFPIAGLALPLVYLRILATRPVEPIPS